MMFFHDRHFPKSGEFIRNEMPHFAQKNPKPFGVFVDYIGGDRALALSATSAGTYPRVKISKDIRKDCNLPGNAVASGCFCPVRPDFIYFPDWCVESFEEGSMSKWNFAGKLLHEAVHWGRFKNGLSSRINDNEAGRLFEIDAGFSNSKGDYWNRKPRDIDDI
ncbi:hypothetical protein MWU54_00970 [Marivita sp. S6314]|uniref:hypothetical protein n=1 Tax=Marivita sp. S6314 TaxID=2926406 RepID=UPI001FF6E169|nr:hypothetical protein [Marivita sp. S6314]MCK0148579.1 hypothetical protein [Marivita sp. S6314]